MANLIGRAPSGALRVGADGTVYTARGGKGVWGGLPGVANGGVIREGQTLSLAGNLTVGQPTGLYLVTYSVQVTTSDAAATSVQFKLQYTDLTGARTRNGAVVLLNAKNTDDGMFTAYLASGDLTYTTTVVAIGAAAYAVEVATVLLQAR